MDSFKILQCFHIVKRKCNRTKIVDRYAKIKIFAITFRFFYETWWFKKERIKKMQLYISIFEFSNATFSFLLFSKRIITFSLTYDIEFLSDIKQSISSMYNKRFLKENFIKEFFIYYLSYRKQSMLHTKTNNLIYQ